MKKHTISIMLVVLLLLLTACIPIGCTSATTSVTTNTTSPVVTTPQIATTTNSNASKSYPLPIVDKKLELTAMINYSVLRPQQDTTTVWDWFADKTNIKMKPTIVKDADKLALLFASREFPDVYMNASATVSQLTVAAADGDLVPIDELVAKFAPTWNKFLNDNPLVKNNCKLSDGKLYFLPNVDFADFIVNLRDQWFISDSWLKELNLKVPTTTEEFVTVMKAIKENAGKGSIPQNVFPFYYLFDSYIGGQFDVYSSFGVTVTNVDYLAVENNKVVYQAINPDLKAPLKYLRELYALGITPPECFTDDWNTYLTKISANPPMVASYGSYANRNPATQTPMAPLQSPNGKHPTMRRQASVPSVPRAFAIFKGNPNPEATIKFCEYLASDLEAKMTAARGIKDVLWKYENDGRVAQIFWEESPSLMTENAAQVGLHNSFCGLLDQNFYNTNFNNLDANIERSRTWAYNNIYKNYLGPEGSVYVAAPLSGDDENLIKIYNTDLTNLRKKTFADWITGKGDIDAEWDAYVAGMKKLNLDAFVALKQKAYDKITATN